MKINIEQNSYIEQWVERWAEWIDLVIATGVVSITVELKQKITLWADDADLLGFNSQALMAHNLIASRLSAMNKAELFQTMILQQDLFSLLYHLEKAETHYAPPTNSD